MPLGVPDVQVFLTEARSNKKRVPCLTATKKGLKTLLSFYITKSVNARVCKRKRVDFLALFMYLWFGVHNYFLLVLLCEKVMLDLICLFFHTSLLTNTFDDKLGFNFCSASEKKRSRWNPLFQLLPITSSNHHTKTCLTWKRGGK